MGVTECDNMLMLLASSQKMTPNERDTVIPMLIKGFRVSYTSCIEYEISACKIVYLYVQLN